MESKRKNQKMGGSSFTLHVYVCVYMYNPTVGKFYSKELSSCNKSNITRIVIRNNGTSMNVSNVCYVFIIIQTILGNVSSVIIVAKLKQSTS